MPDLRFNKSQIRRFKSKGAVKKYLDPVGLFDKVPGREFASNNSQLGKMETPMFEAFHFIKYRVRKAQEDGKHLEFWLNLFSVVRNRLITANISLIYNCIRKSRFVARQDDVSRDDFVSAGNMSLILSVEGFDPWKGARFSTYACRAIVNSFCKVAYDRTRHAACVDVSQFDVPEECNDTNKDLYIERAKAALDKAKLTPRQRDILAHRFYGDETLAQVGKRYNRTKERVRQIETQALQILKEYLEDDKVLA